MNLSSSSKVQMHEIRFFNPFTTKFRIKISPFFVTRALSPDTFVGCHLPSILRARLDGRHPHCTTTTSIVEDHMPNLDGSSLAPFIARMGLVHQYPTMPHTPRTHSAESFSKSIGDTTSFRPKLEHSHQSFEAYFYLRELHVENLATPRINDLF